MRVHATNLKATIDGREYTWGGGFGEILGCLERGVKQGDCRMIGERYSTQILIAPTEIKLAGLSLMLRLSLLGILRRLYSE